MKKGFGYIYFLILVVVSFTLITSLSNGLLKLRSYKKMDLARIQALSMANSAANYYFKKPLLLENSLSNLTLKKLINLPGFEYQLNQGGPVGFKIVNNKGKIYFIGYSGKSLKDYESIKVLLQEGGRLSSWYE